MKRLLLFLTLASGLFAQRVPIVIGYAAAAPGTGSQTCNLVSAAAINQCAYGFRLHTGKTLSKLQIYFSVVSGSPGTNITATLYGSTAAGEPDSAGTILDGPFNVSTTPVAAGMYEFTGWTYAAAASIQYYVIFKNTDGTPQTNGVTIRSGGTQTGQNGTSQTTTLGWSKRASTNTGSTWAASTSQNIIGSMRLEFSDASFEGMAVTNTAITSSTNSVFGTQEIGAIFTTPAGPTLNVRCLSTWTSSNGTPTGELRFRLYTGASATPTLTATTATTLPGAVGANGNQMLCFSAVQAIPPSTVIRVVASETTQSDTSTNRFDFAVHTVDNTAASKALMPFAGTMQMTLSTDGGANFTNTDTAFIPFVMVLDQTTPFTVTAGAGQTGVVRVN